jgi:hypothetical protein
MFMFQTGWSIDTDLPWDGECGCADESSLDLWARGGSKDLRWRRMKRSGLHVCFLAHDCSFHVIAEDPSKPTQDTHHQLASVRHLLDTLTSVSHQSSELRQEVDTTCTEFLRTKWVWSPINQKTSTVNLFSATGRPFRNALVPLITLLI